MFNELLEADIDIGQAGGDQLAVNNNAGRGPTLLTPFVTILIARIIVIFVIPLAKIDHRRGNAANILVTRVTLIEEVKDIIPDRNAFFRVIEELRHFQIKFIECRGGDRGGHTAGDDRLGVRVLAAKKNIGLTRNARHVQRFEIELSVSGLRSVMISDIVR